MNPQTALEKNPINQLLNLRVTSWGADSVELLMPVREEFLQQEEVVQGGMLSAFADSAAALAFMTELPAEQKTTTIEFKMNFLRPSVLQGGDLRAEARVIRRGGTVGVCEVAVFQGETQVAKGTFTNLFFDREPASPAS